MHERARLGLALPTAGTFDFRKLTVAENILAIRRNRSTSRAENAPRASSTISQRLNLTHVVKQKA